MALVSMKEMLLKAKEGKYAVGQFNINNLEWTYTILNKCQEINAPVILGVSEGAVRYMGGFHVVADMVKAVIKDKNITIPVALHLDHGSSFEKCKAALDAGFTSVMIDASHHSFEDNIRITKEVCEYAKKTGASVEAELGKVGGKEDDLEADADTNTDPQEAKEFVERTGVSSLAVAIGTAHGFYVGTPVLDKPRVSAIKEVVDVPLVLHGASGLSEEDVRECVERGMCKVNFATELRVAYTDAVKKLLEEKPETFDPKKLGVVAMEAVKEQVIARMKMCGCDGKAK